MKRKDNIQKTLGLIYNSTFVPIHYYQSGELAASYPVIDMPKDMVDVNRESLRNSGKQLQFFSTKESLHIGYIRNDKTGKEVILGPVSSIPISDDTLDSIIISYGILPEYRYKVKEFFSQTPLFSIAQFLNILALIYKEISGEIIDVFQTFDLLGKDKENMIGEKHSNSLYERKESEAFHDTYFFEQEYYGYVERGDISGLEAMIRNVPNMNEGQIASDSLRQAKNIFIASMALVTRRAIAGGLDIETSYQLSDSYIQEAERMTDASAVTLLNATAVMDFTRRVAETKIPMDMPPDIYKAIQFISNHVNQNISVEDVSEYLGIDRSTLSRKFKKELGFNISSYIMRRKLEEAKSLLIYTDKTISEISEYLCFSTQSYFQNVFKKKYGQTPKEFRSSQENMHK
nr:helix-turn-helix domain-containing protein [uncultured Butyrivibrio sp.]